MSDPIFKTADARERIDDWYQHFADALSSPVEHLQVETSVGTNHVLAAGDADNPPIVCLHGALGSSAHTLHELEALGDHYYLLAPDIPGQSVRGVPERLPLDESSHGHWLLEILDGLGLERVTLLAISWGGFVAQQAASLAPERIERLVLVVPAGVVSGPVWKATTNVMIPLAMYKMFPNEKRLRRLMDGLATTWDEDWAHYLGDAFRSFKLDLRTPPLTKPEQFEGFDAPALVIAADDDLSFPGEPLLERMETLLPHAETELIEDCRHMPPTTDEFRAWLADRIQTFVG